MSHHCGRYPACKPLPDGSGNSAGPFGSSSSSMGGERIRLSWVRGCGPGRRCRRCPGKSPLVILAGQLLERFLAEEALTPIGEISPQGHRPASGIRRSFGTDRGSDRRRFLCKKADSGRCTGIKGSLRRDGAWPFSDADGAVNRRRPGLKGRRVRPGRRTKPFLHRLERPLIRSGPDL